MSGLEGMGESSKVWSLRGVGGELGKGREAVSEGESLGGFITLGEKKCSWKGNGVFL